MAYWDSMPDSPSAETQPCIPVTAPLFSLIAVHWTWLSSLYYFVSERFRKEKAESKNGIKCKTQGERSYEVLLTFITPECFSLAQLFQPTATAAWTPPHWAWKETWDKKMLKNQGVFKTWLSCWAKWQCTQLYVSKKSVFKNYKIVCINHHIARGKR